jgi:hypothetical protein
VVRQPGADRQRAVHEQHQLAAIAAVAARGGIGGLQLRDRLLAALVMVPG